MSLSERQMIKVAQDLGDMSGSIPADVVTSTIDLLPVGIDKAAAHVDSLTRSGRISFRDRDQILLRLCNGDHVKVAHVEAALAQARDSLVEKQASASQVSEEFTEFLLS